MTELTTFIAALTRLAPGTPLRRSVERIIQQGNGALVILGSNAEIEAVAYGGFKLLDSKFSPARMAELAKMDGAIILDDDGKWILRANAHLLPDPSIKTDETGARFRTAERMAKMSARPVLAISEERGQCFVFYADRKQRLSNPSELLARINQEFQTLDHFRQRMVQAEDRLTRLEVTDEATLGDAIAVLQRTELVRRIGERVERLAVDLGEEGHMVDLQQADLVTGVEEVRELIARDYFQENGDCGVEALRVLDDRPLQDIYDTERLSGLLGVEGLGRPVRPPGYRLVSGIPGLPRSVRENLVDYFREPQRLMAASEADLGSVSGVGQTRARTIRRYLDQVERQHRHPLTDL
ncbi:MAG: DNA integrity scanning diadenylate cyclase DisA [bacterium]|nr:DNA integrity scanning diadenylate cyclase DisA [bacterium]